MPVKNAAARLSELLPRLFDQRSNAEIELVAVDSGSTDDTVAVLESAGATILSLDPRSFNHGLTRQLGADYATGDVLVFLNATATPSDRNWLSNLLAPLREKNMIAGVCSRVLPPPEADLLARRDIMRDLSASAERSLRAITDWKAYKALSTEELRAFINFHTVSAAIRPNVLREIPFREVATIGEDIQWAKEVLEAGYQLQHEPTSAVLHCHSFSHRDLLMLNVDDGIANRHIVGGTLREADVTPLISALALEDWRFLQDECQLEDEELDRWRVEAVLRRTAQVTGQWIGTGPEAMVRELQNHLSRIAHLRRQSGAEPAAGA